MSGICLKMLAILNVAHGFSVNACSLLFLLLFVVNTLTVKAITRVDRVGWIEIGELGMKSKFVQDKGTVSEPTTLDKSFGTITKVIPLLSSPLLDVGLHTLLHRQPLFMKGSTMKCWRGMGGGGWGFLKCSRDIDKVPVSLSTVVASDN